MNETCALLIDLVRKKDPLIMVALDVSRRK